MDCCKTFLFTIILFSPVFRTSFPIAISHAFATAPDVQHLCPNNLKIPVRMYTKHFPGMHLTPVGNFGHFKPPAPWVPMGIEEG